MFSLSSKVVVLCWDRPAESDRRAFKSTAFLGADVAFVSLNGAVLDDAESVRKLVPKCACLIVDAQTLAKSADLLQNGVSGIIRLVDLAANVFIYGFQPTDRHEAILRSFSGGGLAPVQPLSSSEDTFKVAGGQRERCGRFSELSLGVVDPSIERSFLEVPS